MKKLWLLALPFVVAQNTGSIYWVKASTDTVWMLPKENAKSIDNALVCDEVRGKWRDHCRWVDLKVECKERYK